jgi:hypothetical protein
MASNAMTPGDADKEPNIERLLRNDRETLSSFLEQLNRGVKIDDMSVELKLWWANRY